VGERQQDLRRGQCAEAGFGGDQDGRKVVDQDGDLLSRSAATPDSTMMRWPRRRRV
jgi:hypothetical protein